MTIAVSHGGTSIYSSSGPSRELLVGTITGVAHLERAGSSPTWKMTGMSLAERHVVAVATDPDRELWCASMHDGGVAVSEDGGKTWQDRNKGLKSSNVYCILATRSNNSIRLYAGTEPAHLYASDDLGRTWEELTTLRSVPSVERWTFPAPPHDAHVKSVSVDPHNASRLYACVEQGGLFRSDDSGASWRELSGFNDDCHRTLMLTSDPHIMYLTTGYGFYRSRDGGDSWETLSDRIRPVGYPDPLLINPLNEDLIIVAGAEADPYHWMETRSANPSIVRSTDGGEHWEVMKTGLPTPLAPNFEAMSLDAWDGGCEIFAANTSGELYYSEDQGESWSVVVDDLPPISKTIHYTILNSDLAFAKHQRA